MIYLITTFLITITLLCGKVHHIQLNGDEKHINTNIHSDIHNNGESKYRGHIRTQRHEDTYHYNQNSKIRDNKNRNNNNKSNTKKPILMVLAFASDETRASKLIEYSQYNELKTHLVGINGEHEWIGLNTKILGYHHYLDANVNDKNNTIIMLLDAYDTIPICNEQEILNRFKEFNADIVYSTGKDCWPDPNAGDWIQEYYKNNNISTNYSYFPFYLCPNSGAIIGNAYAMISMLTSVEKLFAESGERQSCNDFEGNQFGKRVQSDQRCHTSYYINYINKTTEENKHDRFVIKLDHNNSLFHSLGGAFFYDFDIDLTQDKNITFKSYYTNNDTCILHGNGPGMILINNYVKIINNGGNLGIRDRLIHLGFDIYANCFMNYVDHFERLSHWLSVHYNFDLGLHSSDFGDNVVERWENCSYIVLIIIAFCVCRSTISRKIKPYHYHYYTKEKLKKITKKKNKSNKIKNNKCLRKIVNLGILHKLSRMKKFSVNWVYYKLRINTKSKRDIDNANTHSTTKSVHLSINNKSNKPDTSNKRDNNSNNFDSLILNIMKTDDGISDINKNKSPLPKPKVVRRVASVDNCIGYVSS